MEDRYIWLLLYRAVLAIMPCSPTLFSSIANLSPSELRVSVIKAFGVERVWRNENRHRGFEYHILSRPGKAAEVKLLAGGDWAAVRLVGGGVYLWCLDRSGYKVLVAPYKVTGMAYYPHLSSTKREMLVLWRQR